MLYSILLVGQSNMVGSFPYIDELMEEFRVINCAKGGTNSEEWQKGGQWYTRCMKRLANGERPVAAIFHFQGEGNTASQKLSARYLDDTKKLLIDLRQDVSFYNATHGGQPGPVPIILAQIGPYPNDFERPYWGYIQNQQAKIPSKLPTTYMITTDDLTYGIAPHFTPECYEQIGWRFVNKYYEVLMNGQ